jgi:diguanylate cyclase (GGDEF)-like protein
MSRSTAAVNRHPPLRFERNLAVIFAALGGLMTALVSLHWFLVLEPALRTHAQGHARVLAQAEAHTIAQHLGDSNPAWVRGELEADLDGLLLLKDQATGLSFVRRITLAMDDECHDGAHSGLDMARGVEQCPECFVSEIPLYHPQDRQLIGIATFYSSPAFLETLVADIRGKLLLGGASMLLLIGMAWVGTERLLRRLAEGEANLRNLFEAAPFPMVLQDNHKVSLSQANQAARDCLALRQDAAGDWSSETWQALVAAGLPQGVGERRETAIPTPGDAERFALVSTMSVKISNVPCQLVSLVDVSELKAVQRELQRASVTDSLTGLYNRRLLFERLSEETERARRFAHGFSILMLDIDHFKAVNDAFGHQVGDQVLVRVAAELRAVLRDVDTAGRYGGEEFLVILPYADARQALEVAERVRTRLAALTWPQPGLRITVSGGVAEYMGPGIDALVEAADRKLYEAKAAGRNRVVG